MSARWGLLGLLGTVWPGIAAAEGNRLDGWVGTWQVSYATSFSSCHRVMPGEIEAATLTIKVVDGQFQITESAPGGTMQMTWEGDASNMVLIGRHGETSVVMEIGPKWTGRRVLAKTMKEPNGRRACAVIYDVRAKRTTR